MNYILRSTVIKLEHLGNEVGDIAIDTEGTTVDRRICPISVPNWQCFCHINKFLRRCILLFQSHDQKEMGQVAYCQKFAERAAKAKKDAFETLADSP